MVKIQILLIGTFLISTIGYSQAQLPNIQIDNLGCRKFCDCAVRPAVQCFVYRSCDGSNALTSPYCVAFPPVLSAVVVLETVQCGVRQPCGSPNDPVTNCRQKSLLSLSESTSILDEFNKEVNAKLSTSKSSKTTLLKTRESTKEEFDALVKEHPTAYAQFKRVVDSYSNNTIDQLVLRPKRQANCFQANLDTVGWDNCFWSIYVNSGSCCGKDACGSSFNRTDCAEFLWIHGSSTLLLDTFLDPNQPPVPCSSG